MKQKIFVFRFPIKKIDLETEYVIETLATHVSFYTKKGPVRFIPNLFLYIKKR